MALVEKKPIFDFSINLGHLLTIGGALVAMIVGFTQFKSESIQIQSNVTEVAKRQDRLESTVQMLADNQTQLSQSLAVLTAIVAERERAREGNIKR